MQLKVPSKPNKFVWKLQHLKDYNVRLRPSWPAFHNSPTPYTHPRDGATVQTKLITVLSPKTLLAAIYDVM
eukprot:1619980-Amphidinium_carterae.1